MLTSESASEEVLAATIARNELRKQGLSPSQSKDEFLDIFHSFILIPSGLAPKAAKQAEKERVNKLHEYLIANPNLTLE